MWAGLGMINCESSLPGLINQLTMPAWPWNIGMCFSVETTNHKVFTIILSFVPLKMAS